MPVSATTGPGSRYIVRAAGDDGALARFLDSIGADPALHVLETIGPAAAPHTLVVEADPAAIDQLRQRTLNQLMIEPDRPLSLF
ncbi:hypothetical protein G4G28_15910 [Massilia sp. Dwa41.01b]|uniref:hypothetical protein n=1 Tax=unclassified Massilia TaxID=2609279 RepID=UPI00160186E4|nr:MULTISPECIES: hypothetical protein [unclassified Massilia]QNA89586.1 hypothetical protein G4G28_15910 [Massilia sp. Dwa41.01b]QNB00486.1 hypothetical protein G4G31_19495 [Massilia sp. Se16.2.3]